MVIRKYIIILLLLSQYKNEFNQDEKIDVKEYYHIINKAEKLILNSNYTEALAEYNIAFSSSDYFFCTDAYNALVCSIKTQNNLSTKKYYSFLKTRKYDLSDIESIIDQKLNLENIDNTAKNQTVINLELRNFIHFLKSQDQAVRTSRIIDPQIVLDTDISISKSLDSLYEIYGFLSEDLIGSFEKGNSPLEVLIIHQTKLNPKKYETILRNAVRNGQLRNSLFAWYSINFDQDVNKCLKCIQCGMGDVLKLGHKYFTCSEKYMAIVDRNREDIYMKSVSESVLESFHREISKEFKIGTVPVSPPNDVSSNGINKLVEFYSKNELLIEIYK